MRRLYRFIRYGAAGYFQAFRRCPHAFWAGYAFADLERIFACRDDLQGLADFAERLSEFHDGYDFFYLVHGTA